MENSFLGNKTDREDRELPKHVGEEFAHRHSMYFIETSAKEADNVEKLFIEIAKELTSVRSFNHFSKQIFLKFLSFLYTK